MAVLEIRLIVQRRRAISAARRLAVMKLMAIEKLIENRIYSMAHVIAMIFALLRKEPVIIVNYKIMGAE